ncbi:MAG: response regulator [Protaetiibacter sp.]
MSDPMLALVVEDSDDQAELLRERRPDIAVVDLVLPGMTGEELAARIRTTQPECLLVITSVHDSSRYPEADAVLPKPFTGAQLAAIVERARAS